MRVLEKTKYIFLMKIDAFSCVNYMVLRERTHQYFPSRTGAKEKTQNKKN